MAQATNADTELSFGDGGFTKQQGEAALKRESGQPLAAEYATKLQQRLMQIGDDLTPRQQAQFRLRANDLVSSMYRRASVHEAEQQRVYDANSYEAKNDADRQRMGLGWTDPEMVAKSAASIRGTVAQAAQRNGWSPEQTAAETVRALSPGHAAVLTSAIDNEDLDFAREYMKHAAPEMLPAARLQIEHALNIGTAQAKAQQTAGDLWAKHGGDIQAALTDARQTLQGKEQDHVVERLKVFDNERETFKRRAEREAYDAGLLRVEKGQAVPPSLLVSMGDGYAAAISEHQRARARAAERPPRTDWELYLDLREQAANDPGTFSQLDLGRYVDRIGPAQMEQLADLKGKIRAAGGKTDRGTATLQQQLNSTADALKIKDKAKRGELFSYVYSAVDDAQKAAGSKPLTFDDRQKIIDQAVLQGEVSRPFWFNATRRAFELTPDERTRFTPGTPAAAGQPVRVNSEEEYRALPPGTRFITPDGKTGTKR
ncbi:MAG: hypothetical protein QM702_25170 [Rubrivivax sp.]